MKQHPIGRIIEETPNGAWWLGVITLLIFSSIGLIFLIKGFPDNSIRKTDFLAVYVLPKAIYNGDDISSKIDDLAEKYIGNLKKKYFDFPSHHPPTLGLILLPIAFFDYYHAQKIWYLFEILFLLLTIHNLFLIADTHLHWRWIILYTMAFSIINPAVGDLGLGQVNCLLVYLLSAMWLSLKNNNEGSAGIYWGISLMLKQLAWPLLFVLIFHRKYRTIFWSAITITLGYIIIGYIVGTQAIIKYYVNTLPPLYEYHVNSPWNSALLTIGKRITDGAYFKSSNMPVFTLYPLFPQLKTSAFLTLLLQYLLPITVLFLSIIRMIQINSFDGSFALFSGLILLINPITWDYFYLFALIPLTRVIQQLRNQRFPLIATYLALLLFLIISIHYISWINFAILIEKGTLYVKDPTTVLTFHYTSYLPVYIPAIATLILSFMAAQTGRESTLNEVD